MGEEGEPLHAPLPPPGPLFVCCWGLCGGFIGEGGGSGGAGGDGGAGEGWWRNRNNRKTESHEEEERRERVCVRA